MQLFFSFSLGVVIICQPSYGHDACFGLVHVHGFIPLCFTRLFRLVEIESRSRNLGVHLSFSEVTHFSPLLFTISFLMCSGACVH